MKLCVLGLGAIGSWVASRLAKAARERTELADLKVSGLARGATLAAIQARGIRAERRTPEGIQFLDQTPLQVSSSAQALGVQDVIVVSVKTTALAILAEQAQPMIGPNTLIISMMNGVPWWFFEGLDAARAAEPLNSIDPQGKIAQWLPPKQVIGTVTHLSASCPAPGRVLHNSGQRIIFGEPDARHSVRLKQLVRMFELAGFEVPIAEQRIQQDIWFKLLGNMTMNPMSAITGVTCDKILDDPQLRDFLSNCMREMMRVGARIGVPIELDPEERHVVTRKLGAFKTSMLQDVEAQRPIELDALVTAVAEMAVRVDEPVPNIQTLLAIARVRSRALGLYP